MLCSAFCLARSLPTTLRNVRRYAAAPTAVADVPLRALMRQFVKRVHPDRLRQTHPKAAEHNEQQLQRFLQTIDLWKVRPNGNPFLERESQRFDFFVRASELARASGAVATRAGSATVEERVTTATTSSTAAPAATTASPQSSLTTTRVEHTDDSTLARLVTTITLNAPYAHVRDALASLFALCGLPTHFVLDGSAPTLHSDSLEQFLHEHAEAARTKHSEYTDLVRQANELVNELRRRVGLSTSTSEHRELTMSEWVDVLSMFLAHIHLIQPKQLDALRERSLKLVFDQALQQSEVDSSQGAIFLAKSHTPDSWMHFINSIDLSAFALSAPLGLDMLVRKQKEEMMKSSNAAQQQQQQQQQQDASSSQPNPEAELQAATSNVGLQKMTEDEATVAEILGVRWVRLASAVEEDVKSGNEAQELIQYQRLIASIAAKKKENIQRRPWKPGKFKNLELRFVLLPDDKMFYVSGTGSFYVSTRIANFEQLVQLIQREGPPALSLQRDADEYDTIRQYVQVRLGLRELGVNKLWIASEPHHAALAHATYKRLRDAADKLREQNPKGIRLGISDRFVVTDDGAMYFPFNAPMTASDTRKMIEREKK